MNPVIDRLMSELMECNDKRMEAEVEIHNLKAKLAAAEHERNENKQWSEELAKDLCEMEDALGFKQDQHDKDGAFVPTKVPWLERVRDLIAAESERDDLRSALKECVEALDKLARLGNEPALGNSIGNVIAQQALTKAKEALK